MKKDENVDGRLLYKGIGEQLFIFPDREIMIRTKFSFRKNIKNAFIAFEVYRTVENNVYASFLNFLNKLDSHLSPQKPPLVGGMLMF